MPTTPAETERKPTPAERVTRAVVAPVERIAPVTWALAAAAAASTFAPDLIGAVAVALLVIVAAEPARRR
jgi:hypothetical protein